MVNPLRSCGTGDELSVSRRQPSVTTPKHLVTVDRALPYRTIFRPALRSYEETRDQALGHPPMMRDERQIDIDQRVGLREPFPGGGDGAKAVDDPFVLPQQIRMRFQVLLLRDFAAAGPKLH